MKDMREISGLSFSLVDVVSEEGGDELSVQGMRRGFKWEVEL
jgi:hypothetical protein